MQLFHMNLDNMLRIFLLIKIDNHCIHHTHTHTLQHLILSQAYISIDKYSKHNKSIGRILKMLFGMLLISFAVQLFPLLLLVLIQNWSSSKKCMPILILDIPMMEGSEVRTAMQLECAKND